jgi:hypothetical protein
LCCGEDFFIDAEQVKIFFKERKYLIPRRFRDLNFGEQ